MPKIEYVPKRFNARHRAIIDRANEIIEDYARQGFDLTLRQLYYRFVAGGHMENKQQNYKMLGSVISDARRAGEIDWDRIVDRTRFVRTPPAWDGPEAIVQAVAQQFDVDWWESQQHRPEVWIEKDALVGVLQSACERWHVPYFSCRGYTSDSEVWAAARRLRRYHRGGQTPIVFHLGDHDPSGIDMTRDIFDRVKLFAGVEVEVKRLALNMDQVEQYDPPPNPAKETDSRFEGYRDLYGDESWELDALAPTTIDGLIAREMEAIIDQTNWAVTRSVVARGRRQLQLIADNWDNITSNLEE